VLTIRTRYRAERSCWEVALYRGRRRVKRKSFASEAEAREWAAEAELQQTQRDRFGQRDEHEPLPIATLCREWVEVYRETFSRGYEATATGLVEHHLAPHFGDRDLRTLTEGDALAFATAVVRAKRSPSVARNALTILSRVVELHRRHLPVNPLRGFRKTIAAMERRHGGRQHAPDAWSLEELRKILALARKHEPWLYPLVVFASHTGARQGEAIGLRWEDVDFQNRRVYIRGQVTRGEETGRKGGGKALSVPFDAASSLLGDVLEALAAGRRLREGGADPGYVFRTATGARVDEANLRRAWRRLAARFPESGVRPLRWHDFRHTFVSHALAAGRGLKTVSGWVGHSTTYITERYAHAIPEDAGGGFLELDQRDRARTGRP
jgi:integrase